MMTVVLRSMVMTLTLFSLWAYAETLPGKILEEKWGALLQAYVVKGQVDYAAMAEGKDLKVYVDYVAEKDISSLKTTAERLVFYINAYNALAIEGILRGRSPNSFFGRIGFFRSEKYQIAGSKTNLYDFEHKVIRPLGEPRIHFALVCASASCPELRSEAYSLTELEHQLDENARNFINDEGKNWFDTDKKIAYLSMIFKWFREDFETDGLTLQQYIAQYVKDDSIANSLKNNEFEIKYLQYDWSLNGSK